MSRAVFCLNGKLASLHFPPSVPPVPSLTPSALMPVLHQLLLKGCRGYYRVSLQMQLPQAHNAMPQLHYHAALQQSVSRSGPHCPAAIGWQQRRAPVAAAASNCSIHMFTNRCSVWDVAALHALHRWGTLAPCSSRPSSDHSSSSSRQVCSRKQPVCSASSGSDGISQPPDQQQPSSGTVR